MKMHLHLSWDSFPGLSPAGRIALSARSSMAEHATGLITWPTFLFEIAFPIGATLFRGSTLRLIVIILACFGRRYLSGSAQ